MGIPQAANLVPGFRRLKPDGSNIGDYLLHLYENYPKDFTALIETLRYVLPYASDLTPAMTSELTRNVYLQLTEGSFKVPGWLLSTGTLRIVALLAVLRHPEPPPLICIEELENGLDPRTIHLIVEEIRDAVQRRGIQVIITTHSPYLLDLLPLSSLILCERDAAGEPKFYRPADDESMKRWAADFAPGQLYTMGQLKRNA